jgi:hypothetical protein
MRCPSLIAFLALAACSPTLNPYGSSGAQPTSDASALVSAFGDDGGDRDDGTEDANEPGWDASSPPAPDTGVPVTRGDDASAPMDAGVDGDCTQPLGEGDLLIDELMIESVAGAGDDGEWLEVTSTVGCAINLRGLHGDCPVGAKVHTFDVTEDVWLPPGGSFIIADSQDPAVNHDLPGLVLAWSGQPGDVLRNLGGTVTLSANDELIVSLTWPDWKVAVGVSMALPADCPPSDAGDVDPWERSIWSWFPGFYGTPNAPNVDVPCP